MKKLLLGLLVLGSFSAFSIECNTLRIPSSSVFWYESQDEAYNVEVCADIMNEDGDIVLTNITPFISPKRLSDLPTFSIGTKSNIGRIVCELITGIRPDKVKVQVASDFVEVLAIKGRYRGLTQGVTTYTRTGEPAYKNKYLDSIRCIEGK